MASRTNCILAALLSALALFLGVAPDVNAQGTQFVVVVNRSNPVNALSRSEVSAMFMRRRTSWPRGGAVSPVDLAASSGVRQAFSRAVHRRSTSAVAAHWRSQIFSGRGVPPPELASSAAVVRYVGSHSGAIGYAGEGGNLHGCKVIRVTD